MSQPQKPGLNVIALISGGKDSFYSILHCLRNGHNVVALANLHPQASTKDEDIDSFMYQTIGHSVISLYEEALGIPLYRAEIKGGAVDTARVYRHDAADQAAEAPSIRDEDEDETESLVPLLRRIMKAHPNANAVSAGAILSTYQRTRIENIAGRLGLVPLAWLWMYPSLPAPVERDESQTGLLEDMAAAGCDARIIKVASGGLDDGFLWENVSGVGNGGQALRRRILKAMSRFAAPEDIKGSVLGEGGEYETLALDGPSFLWKKKIEISTRETGSAEGGVAFMKLKDAKIVTKDREDDLSPAEVRRPVLLDAKFIAADHDVRSISFDTMGSKTQGSTGISPAWSICKPHHCESEKVWTIANIVAPEAGPGAGDQMSAIIDKVRLALRATRVRSTDDIVFATVLLRSMDDFALMNNVYNSLFKRPNPPARATVACGDALPSNVKVMVSFVVDEGDRNHRQGLHVQSRSYWAPANIGPYSQAISIPMDDQTRVVYIAGQIPLEPASMELATRGTSWFDSYCLRAVLALQHLWRIGEAMHVNWWLGAVAFVTGGELIETQVRVVWSLWKKVHSCPESADEDDEGPQLDAWDIKYGGRAEELVPEVLSSELPNFTVLNEGASTTISPFLAVQVDELPRGSDIEWQGLGSQCAEARLESDEGYVSATTGRYSYTSIEIDGDSDLEESLRSVLTSQGGEGVSQMVLYTTQPIPEDLWKGQIVPCRSVWGMEGRQVIAAVVVQKDV